MHEWEEHHIEETVDVDRCTSCGAIKLVFLRTLQEVYLKGGKFCGNNSVVECFVANENVAGSSPVSRFNKID